MLVDAQHYCMLFIYHIAYFATLAGSKRSRLPADLIKLPEGDFSVQAQPVQRIAPHSCKALADLGRLDCRAQPQAVAIHHQVACKQPQ